MSDQLVLVTGGSGFVGTHCIIQLVQAGYRVRTTVRSLAREADVRAMLKTGGVEPGDALEFVAADLTSDGGWPEAVAGCEYVLHVASPFPFGAPENEDDLIVPAREGALRVLRAARDAGAKRVVLTSSFAAVGYGQAHMDRPFNETDWTNLDGGDIGAYVKSKTIAERAAWDFISKEGGALELSVVNPVAIFGPVLGPDYSTSIALLQGLLTGSTAVIPRVSFSAVDVRDVADLHLRAMVDPAANGERFLAVAGAPMSLPEIAHLLRTRMGSDASRVSTKVLPDFVVRFGALFNPTLRQVVPRLGPSKPASNEKAKRVLGWEPRSNDDSVIATGESLIRLGLLASPTKAA
jgi:nucleoside-diphosphate-sugar epimerase